MRGASPHQRGRPQRVVLAQAASPINYSSARQRMAERLAHCRTFRVPWLSFRSPAGVSLRPANDSWQHRSFVRKLLVWEALDRLSAIYFVDAKEATYVHHHLPTVGTKAQRLARSAPVEVPLKLSDKHSKHSSGTAADWKSNAGTLIGRPTRYHVRLVNKYCLSALLSNLLPPLPYIRLRQAHLYRHAENLSSKLDALHSHCQHEPSNDEAGGTYAARRAHVLVPRATAADVARLDLCALREVAAQDKVALSTAAGTGGTVVAAEGRRGLDAAEDGEGGGEGDAHPRIYGLDASADVPA